MNRKWTNERENGSAHAEMDRKRKWKRKCEQACLAAYSMPGRTSNTNQRSNTFATCCVQVQQLKNTVDVDQIEEMVVETKDKIRALDNDLRLQRESRLRLVREWNSRRGILSSSSGGWSTLEHAVSESTEHPINWKAEFGSLEQRIENIKLEPPRRSKTFRDVKKEIVRRELYLQSQAGVYDADVSTFIWKSAMLGEPPQVQLGTFKAWDKCSNTLAVRRLAETELDSLISIADDIAVFRTIPASKSAKLHLWWLRMKLAVKVSPVTQMLRKTGMSAQDLESALRESRNLVETTGASGMSLGKNGAYLTAAELESAYKYVSRVLPETPFALPSRKAAFAFILRTLKLTLFDALHHPQYKTPAGRIVSSKSTEPQDDDCTPMHDATMCNGLSLQDLDLFPKDRRSLSSKDSCVEIIDTTLRNLAAHSRSSLMKAIKRTREANSFCRFVDKNHEFLCRMERYSSQAMGLSAMGIPQESVVLHPLSSEADTALDREMNDLVPQGHKCKEQHAAAVEAAAHLANTFPFAELLCLEHLFNEEDLPAVSFEVHGQKIAASELIQVACNSMQIMTNVPDKSSMSTTAGIDENIQAALRFKCEAYADDISACEEENTTRLERSIRHAAIIDDHVFPLDDWQGQPQNEAIEDYVKAKTLESRISKGTSEFVQQQD